MSSRMLTFVANAHRGSVRLFPMWRPLRSMLLWFLAVALPLQGISAATMAACGTGHHGNTSTASQAGIPSHGGHLAAMHVHSYDASGAHEHAGADQAQSAKAGLAKSVGHKCSACASCCLNAVAATETPSFETARLSHRFAAPVTRALAAYVTEGLERPPRSFLA